MSVSFHSMSEIIYIFQIETVLKFGVFGRGEDEELYLFQQRDQYALWPFKVTHGTARFWCPSKLSGISESPIVRVLPTNLFFTYILVKLSDIVVYSVSSRRLSGGGGISPKKISNPPQNLVDNNIVFRCKWCYQSSAPPKFEIPPKVKGSGWNTGRLLLFPCELWYRTETLLARLQR